MSTETTQSADWDSIKAILHRLSVQTEKDKEAFQAYQRENDRIIQEGQAKRLADQQKIDKIIQASQAERLADQQKIDQIIQEHQKMIRENRQMIKENQKMSQESREMIQASEKRIKHLDYLFNSHWGALVESLVEGGLLKLLNQQGIPVNNVFCRRRGQHDGDHFEFDLIAQNGAKVVVVEVKTTLRPKDVKQFIQKMHKIKAWLPEYQDKIVYGGMAWLREHGSAATMAEKRGLFNIRAIGDSTSIINADGFIPYTF